MIDYDFEKAVNEKNEEEIEYIDIYNKLASI